MSEHESPSLEAALAVLRVGIVSVDGQGRVEVQNPEASRILGASFAATRGHTLAERLGAQHPAARLLHQTLESARDVTENGCKLPCRDGDRPLICDLAVAPLEEKSGAVLTLHDRTISLELEALVDQRQRADLYAQLAAGIAHEVRNPLGGIRGTAELLEGKLESPALIKYPRLIREETDRITRLLDDLAELTRGGDLRPRRVNVHEVLDKLLSLQERSPAWREIDLRREYDPSLPELDLDPDRMTQVFLNLAKNAVQAMEGCGRLTVRTRFETIYQLAPPSADRGRHHMLRIDFEDTGPGIAEEHLPHVFTPFFTRREGGTGLGLAIAQHWVVRHGGQIQVTAGHADGTRVRVLLPLVRT